MPEYKTSMCVPLDAVQAQVRPCRFNLSTANVKCKWMHSLLNQAAIIWTNSPPQGANCCQALFKTLRYHTAIGVGCSWAERKIPAVLFTNLICIMWSKQRTQLITKNWGNANPFVNSNLLKDFSNGQQANLCKLIINLQFSWSITLG